MDIESRWPFSGLRFDEVHLAPTQPGLYAWYHQVQVSSADIASYIARLEQLDVAGRRIVAERFLIETFFSIYRETDYQVRLGGPLKPEYEGHVSHRPRLSDLLINLAAEKPTELYTLKQLLNGMVPYFASPIYIGIATRSLRQRLTRHRALIHQYREVSARAPSKENDADHSFAFEAVCTRNIVPTELLVYVLPVSGNVTDEVAKSTEYMLNRINYPLCGRN